MTKTRFGIMYQKSEIILLPFPFTDFSSSKKRPVLLLTKPNLQGDFLAAQITSQSGYDFSLLLEQDDLILGTLPKTSFIRYDKLVTLNKSLIVHRIGQLSDSSFLRVKQAICLNFGCLF